MARFSPITVGAVVLAALVALAAAYLLVRSPPPATAEGPDAATPSASVAPSVLPPRLPLAPTRAQLPPHAPAALSHAVPPAPEAPKQSGGLMAAVEAIRSPSPLDKGASPVRRFPAAALAWRRYRITQQADDIAFEALKLDEATRAAIRNVNETHRPLPGRLFASLPDGGSLDPDRLHDADGTTRRAAIEGVLGSNAAKDFFSAEASARASIENQTAAANAANAAGSDGGQPARSSQPADAGADPRGQPSTTPLPPAPAAPATPPVSPEGTAPPATLPGVEGADPAEPSPSPPP